MLMSGSGRAARIHYLAGTFRVLRAMLDEAAGEGGVVSATASKTCRSDSPKRSSFAGSTTT